MPFEELDEKSEIKEKQALEDLHKNFNQHIKFIADRTYLQKFPESKDPKHKYDPNPQVTDFKEEFVENREFSTLLKKPEAEIKASIEAEYKTRKKKKKFLLIKFMGLGMQLE